MRLALAAAFILMTLSAVQAQPAADRAWLELTGRGPELRLVTAADHCPEARLDGRSVPMRPRAAPSAAFPGAVCTVEVPAGVKSAAVGGWTAPLHRDPPQRILIFGDTGCRLKGDIVQACNDPRRWPFALVAARAAAQHPDLVIHVGDYYYRETPCPAGNTGCSGSPFGDNWRTWDAEFFTPAAPLLDGAPWVFVRGNHESCVRGGAGWFRLLDAAAEVVSCPAESAEFNVDLGDLSLAVLDSANTEDRAAPKAAVDAFSHQVEEIGAAGGKPVWLLTHRPIWAMVPVAKLGPFGPVGVAINTTEQDAVRGHDLAGIQMIVSGHIHHFASYDFGPARPAQLVAGTGGDVGEDAESTRPRSGTPRIDGLSAEAFSFGQYGYLLLERSGSDWTGVFRDLDDKPVATCRLHERRLACQRAKGS